MYFLIIYSYYKAWFIIYLNCILTHSMNIISGLCHVEWIFLVTKMYFNCFTYSFTYDFYLQLYIRCLFLWTAKSLWIALTMYYHFKSAISGIKIIIIYY